MAINHLVTRKSTGGGKFKDGDIKGKLAERYFAKRVEKNLIKSEQYDFQAKQ
jgi:hypothetical protein